MNIVAISAATTGLLLLTAISFLSLGRASGYKDGFDDGYEYGRRMRRIEMEERK